MCCPNIMTYLKPDFQVIGRATINLKDNSRTVDVWKKDNLLKSLPLSEISEYVLRLSYYSVYLPSSFILSPVTCLHSMMALKI